MNITIVRLFNVVGPHQTGKYGMVLPRFVKQAVKGEPITVYGDGSQVRSFIDINDCINMLQLLCENEDTKGEIVNVGTSHEITIKELASTVKRLANSQSEIVYIPYDEAYGLHFEEIYHRKPDLNKLNKLIEYSPKLTIEDTISRLIDIQDK
jgi:UDP-glucose 4-epimerase